MKIAKFLSQIIECGGVLYTRQELYMELKETIGERGASYFAFSSPALRSEEVTLEWLEFSKQVKHAN